MKLSCVAVQELKSIVPLALHRCLYAALKVSIQKLTSGNCQARRGLIKIGLSRVSKVPMLVPNVLVVLSLSTVGLCGETGTHHQFFIIQSTVRHDLQGPARTSGP